MNFIWNVSTKFLGAFRTRYFKATEQRRAAQFDALMSRLSHTRAGRRFSRDEYNQR